MTVAYKRKTRDAYAIKVNYGYGHGWEHECTEYTWKESREQLRTYRANVSYPVRARRFRDPLENSNGTT
jgi:hypothetical protein